jgi:hypothetical protein
MTLYDVSEATRAVNEAVGEDVDTNIIFGAVSDSTMSNKIRVTVIATGFNDQSLAKKREEAASPKLALAVPGVKKEPEKKVEQIAMTLHFPQQGEKAEARAADPMKTAAVDTPAVGVTISNGAVSPSGSVAPSAPMDFPAFLKPENMRKEPRTYVSKGSVITQYEDDIEVPTFLRKQMQ